MRTAQRCMAAVLMLLLVVWSVQCSSDGDASSLAEDLANRLTDALEFENGTQEQGEAPDGSDEAAAPQITQLVAPLEMRVGEPFALEVYTDFAQAGEVSRAIVAVKDATKYLQITAATTMADSGNVMYLSGILLADEELKGRSFSLSVALQTDGGLTGAYASWNISVLNLSGSAGGNYVDTMDVGGATWSDTGRPDGSDAQDAPQISGVQGPEFILPGQTFSVVLESINATASSGVQTIVATLPKSPGYKAISSFEVNEQDGLTRYIVQVMLPASALPMRNMVVLWALQNADGATGLFAPWTAEVEVPVSIDGDVDAVPTEEEAESDSAAAKCACGEPGVTLTAVSCTWDDAEECTGWTSVCHEYGYDGTEQFEDGTELTSWDCTIRINCP